MTRDISEVSLDFEPADTTGLDETDIDVLDAEVLDGVDDDRPHLVFLIPGIRTDGWWAQDARRENLLWEGREILFVPVRGNGGGVERLSTWHLVTRLGLSGFRQSFVEQMRDISSREDYATVNVFAHSMGSALFADIVHRAAADLPGGRFDTVAFLGSVCHRRHARTLYDRAHLFVNDVGTRDYWPFAASIVRPFAYNDVGFAGFLNAYAFDRFFPNDHESCTSLRHLREELVPLISTGSDVRPLGRPLVRRPKFNTFVYLRRAAWGLMAAIAGSGIYGLWRIFA